MRPSVAYARDWHGGVVGVIALNDWAPLVNAPGARAARRVRAEYDP